MYQGLLISSVALLSVGMLSAQGVRVEDSDASIVYSGNWNAVADANASGGGFRSSNSEGASLTFKFTGDTLTIYRTMDTDGGQADLQIDGKPWGPIVFVFYQKAYQVPVVLDNLGAGQHTLVLTVNGSRPNIFAGTTTYIDAFQTPAQFVLTGVQQNWVTVFNQMRTGLSLPPVRISLPLTMAAQAHADYMAQNDYGLAEKAGRPGFTGFFSSNRRDYVGYPKNVFTTELLSRNSDAAAALADWNAGVYTRLYLVDYLSGDVGFGANTKGSTMLVANRNGVGALQSRQIILCPADKQINVPLVYVEEDTNPLPTDPRPLGFPISLHVNIPPNAPPGNDNVATTATLTGPNGAVPSKLIWTQTDQNQQIRDRNHYYLVPLQPLAQNTVYTAQITGLDQSQNKFDVTWSFTTSGAAAPPPPPGAATFIAMDTTTSGSWQGTYGADGFIVVGDSQNIPNYVSVNPRGFLNFVWAASTSDPRAPQKGVGQGDRIAACWYTNNAVDPVNGNSFAIDFRFTDTAPHPVAIYLLDWDGLNGGRSETIDVLDATGKVLDTRPATSYGNGLYLVWNLSGQVTIRVTNNNPNSNAVLGGVFFK